MLQLLVPNLLAGTIIGVFLNAISPDWLITIGLVLALGYSGLSAARKAWSLYAEESKKASVSEAAPLMGSGGSGKRQLPAKHYSFDSKENMDEALYEIVEKESRTNFKVCASDGWMA